MNNITASTQGDTISRSALLYAIRENKELYERERVYLEGLILNAPTVVPQLPREVRQALEVLEHIKERYILVEKSPTDDPNALLVAGQPNETTKEGQAERNCEKCEHYKLKTEGVPGDGLYGCELWDCIYERGQADE